MTEEYTDRVVKIKVIGVGGAGNNVVNRMIASGMQGVEFIAVNTDKQDLNKSKCENKIQIGEKLTGGMGAGSKPDIGKKSAEESRAQIAKILEGTDMVFITAGMGGGTGTGASPVIAKLAKEMGLLTVAIVTSPLAVEGKPRYEQAFRGIDELRKTVDSLLIINNENILELYGRLSLKQAFGKADDILSLATKGIAEIITVESDLVNVDFADVSKVMRNSGRAHMAVATAEGEHRAQEAAAASLHSPLLDHNQIAGAKNILLNISVDRAENLIYQEVIEILNFIQAHASVKEADGTIHTANIIWGTSEKPSLGEKLELVVVATGFESEEQDADELLNRITEATPTFEIAQPQPVAAPEPLEPIKPVTVRQPQRPAEPAVLGARPNRYGNIGVLLAKPAYQSRNSKFIVQTTKTRKEVLRDDRSESETQGTSDNGSLF